jgi:hypothetical protein
MTDEERAKQEWVVICVRYSGQTLKLAWCRESRTGVYYGCFGRAKDQNFHWSYHSDGEIHITRGGGQFHGKATPIDEIVGLRPIHGATTIAISSLERATDTFRPNDRARHIFLSESSDFTNYTHLSISQYLMDCSSEAEFEKLLALPQEATMEDASGNRVTVPLKNTVFGRVTIPLQHHPKHKLAVRLMALTLPKTA